LEKRLRTAKDEEIEATKESSEESTKPSKRGRRNDENHNEIFAKILIK
jgi:hypothetical protein